jgi:hypothetical protein
MKAAKSPAFADRAWSPDDIPYAQIDQRQVPQDGFLLSLVATASFLEITSDVYTATLGDFFAGDADMVGWLTDIWQREELRHGLALKRYVEAAWPDFVANQFLGLAEIGAHERHAAVRQLHMRGLDHQRQPGQRDRLMAPVELICLAWREAQRNISLDRNPRLLSPPSLGKPMHAIVRTVIAAPAQLFEQALRRAAFPPRQLGFLFQNLGQNADPLAKLRRRLHVAFILELRRLATDHLAHRRTRYRQPPHDLFDRSMLLKIRSSD